MQFCRSAIDLSNFSVFYGFLMPSVTQFLIIVNIFIHVVTLTQKNLLMSNIYTQFREDRHQKRNS